MHLGPGVGAGHLSQEVLVRLRSESEVALVHELGVDLFRGLFGVAQLVVLDRRVAHPLDHRRNLAPRTKLALGAGEPPFQCGAERESVRQGAIPFRVIGRALTSRVVQEPARQQRGGQNRYRQGQTDQQAAERAVAWWTAGHWTFLPCFVSRRRVLSVRESSFG